MTTDLRRFSCALLLLALRDRFSKPGCTGHWTKWNMRLAYRLGVAPGSIKEWSLGYRTINEANWRKLLEVARS